MRGEIALLIRFFLYGFICFAVFSLLLEAPTIGVREISYKLITYLALAGGTAMVISCAACRVIYHLYKELICGHG